MKITLFTMAFLVYVVSYSQKIEINSDNIISKEIIQNHLQDYKFHTDSIINQDVQNANAYRVSAFIDILQFRYSKVSSKINKAIYTDSIMDNKIGLAEDYNILGRFYKDIQKNDSAIFYYSKATDLFNNNNEKIAAYHFYDLGSMYSILRKKDSAVIYYNNAKNLHLKTKDTLGLLHVNLKLASLFDKSIGENDIKLLHELYNFSLKTNNLFSINDSKFLLANSYMKFKDSLSKAKLLFDETVNYFEETNNLYSLNLVLLNNAHVSLKLLGKEAYLNLSEKHYEFVKDTDNMMREALIYNLGDTYFNLGRIFDAEKKFNEIIEISKVKDVQSILVMLAYKGLSEVYEQNKMFSKALEAHKNYKKIEDETYSLRISEQANKYKVQFETELKERENLQLKANQAEQAELLALESKRKWQMAGGLAISFATLGVFGFYYKRNQKQKKAIETLQKELHHRVKNNLSIIDTFIEVAKEEFNNPDYNSKLSELQNRIESIHQVHAQLYQNKDITNLNLKNYIDTLAENVHQTFNKQNITIEQHVPNNLKIDAKKSFPVGLIINEFLTNSYKYAFPENPGSIILALEENNNQITLKLSDNGKGLPKNFAIDKTDSFGFRIMKLLTQQLKGTFDLKSENGVNLTIQFPK